MAQEGRFPLWNGVIALDQDASAYGIREDIRRGVENVCRMVGAASVNEEE